MNIDDRIAKEGMAFFTVGSREYLKCNDIKKEDDIYSMFPAIVNLAFSIELFLKSMLDNPPHKHELTILLKKVSDNEQNAIVQITIEKMKQQGVELSEDEFWNCLEVNKEAFEDWRYFYERGKTANILFLYSLASVLNNLLCTIVTINRNRQRLSESDCK